MIASWVYTEEYGDYAPVGSEVRDMPSKFEPSDVLVVEDNFGRLFIDDEGIRQQGGELTDVVRWMLVDSVPFPVSRKASRSDIGAKPISGRLSNGDYIDLVGDAKIIHSGVMGREPKDRSVPRCMAKEGDNEEWFTVLINGDLGRSRVENMTDVMIKCDPPSEQEKKEQGEARANALLGVIESADVSGSFGEKVLTRLRNAVDGKLASGLFPGADIKPCPNEPSVKAIGWRRATKNDVGRIARFQDEEADALTYGMLWRVNSDEKCANPFKCYTHQELGSRWFARCEVEVFRIDHGPVVPGAKQEAFPFDQSKLGSCGSCAGVPVSSGPKYETLSEKERWELAILWKVIYDARQSQGLDQGLDRKEEVDLGLSLIQWTKAQKHHEGSLARFYDGQGDAYEYGVICTVHDDGGFSMCELQSQQLRYFRKCDVPCGMAPMDLPLKTPAISQENTYDDDSFYDPEETKILAEARGVDISGLNVSGDEVVEQTTFGPVVHKMAKALSDDNVEALRKDTERLAQTKSWFAAMLASRRIDPSVKPFPIVEPSQELKDDSEPFADALAKSMEAEVGRSFDQSKIGSCSSSGSVGPTLPNAIDSEGLPVLDIKYLWRYNADDKMEVTNLETGETKVESDTPAGPDVENQAYRTGKWGKAQKHHVGLLCRFWIRPGVYSYGVLISCEQSSDGSTSYGCDSGDGLGALRYGNCEVQVFDTTSANHLPFKMQAMQQIQSQCKDTPAHPLTANAIHAVYRRVKDRPKPATVSVPQEFAGLVDKLDDDSKGGMIVPDDLAAQVVAEDSVFPMVGTVMCFDHRTGRLNLLTGKGPEKVAHRTSWLVARNIAKLSGAAIREINRPADIKEGS